MSRFVFKYVYDGNDDNFNSVRQPSKQVHYVCDDEYLDDIVENFSQFLRGCGFVFDNIEVVNHDDGEYHGSYDEYERFMNENEFNSETDANDWDRPVVSEEWKWTVNEISKHAK